MKRQWNERARRCSNRCSLDAARLIGVATAFVALPAAAQDYIWALAAEEGIPENYSHAMAYDSHRGVTVLFGGNRGQLVGATREWNGLSWELVQPTVSPAARASHAMAFDEARGVTVVFGGESGSPRGDTWVWNGTDWVEFQVPGPSARMDHSMAYDSARSRIVLFGGRGTGGQILGDTWEWDGSGWTGRSINGPGPRTEHAMAYDSIRGRTVMFGGTPDNISRPASTWEWDGVSWSLRSTTGTVGFPERIAMAYDPQQRRVIRYDGDFLNSITWLWDGAVWTTMLGSQPSPRYRYAMVFDTARGKGVLFGGYSSQIGPRNDTWELSRWCYANCDGSTIVPRLNVNDFLCFQTRYAAGETYANCDGSTIVPVLNVNDFLCFQNKYVEGCF